MGSKAKRRGPRHRSGSDLVGEAASRSQNASRRGSARATPTSRAPHGWVALLLIVATLAVFYPVRHHEFVDYDDAIQIVQNPQIREGLGVAGLTRAFQPYGSNWIPLTWISYQINYAFSGLEPGGYLLTNVALHLAQRLRGGALRTASAPRRIRRLGDVAQGRTLGLVLDAHVVRIRTLLS